MRLYIGQFVSRVLSSQSVMNNQFQSDPRLPVDDPVSSADESAAPTDSVRIPVIEEQIRIDKQVVETGTVRISKQVIEEPQTIDVSLLREDVIVSHVAVYQYVDVPPAVRYEGETMIIPVLREVLVTEKKLLLVEEVHVTKRQTTEQESLDIILRKEEITVERSSPNDERPA